MRRRLAILSGVPPHLLEILCVAGILGLVAVKIALRQDLSAVVGSLSAFAVAAMKLMPSAKSINSTINRISYLMPGLNAVCELIDDNWGTDIGQAVIHAETRDRNRLRKQADIRVEHLSFRYPESETPVLQDVSFTVKAGTSVGIVGVTGAGKTTLVDLILGLLEPQQGRILFDGRDIRENYQDWQSRIGYIPQNIYLTDESIRANVALGLYATQIDDAKVWKAPDVLFLDEATAALDNATEKAVMAAVNALSREKTCIIIAHRLTTIEDCDSILEVRDGRVFRQR